MHGTAVARKAKVPDIWATQRRIGAPWPKRVLPPTRVSYGIFWGDDYPHYPEDPVPAAGSSRNWTDRVWFSEKPCNDS
jgi:hypothetical protein